MQRNNNNNLNVALEISVICFSDILRYSSLECESSLQAWNISLIFCCFHVKFVTQFVIKSLWMNGFLQWNVHTNKYFFHLWQPPPICEASIMGQMVEGYCQMAATVDGLSTDSPPLSMLSVWHRKPGQLLGRWRGLLIRRTHTQRHMETKWHVHKCAHRQTGTYSPPVCPFITLSISGDD